MVGSKLNVHGKFEISANGGETAWYVRIVNRSAVQGILRGIYILLEGHVGATILFNNSLRLV